MPPEYAMLGQFSEKSDVFSFGVMVLEIITGKKNLSSHEPHLVAKGLLSYVSIIIQSIIYSQLNYIYFNVHQ